MRVLVIFHRLGPYHHARLRAANAVKPIVALEVSGRDATYAWKAVQGETEFERHTAFQTADSETVSTKKVFDTITGHLDTIAPDVVAIPGIYDRAALSALWWCRRKGVPALLMSESTERDFDRAFWKEWIKRQLLRCFSATLVGGQPQSEYVGQLGIPLDRIFVGYDAVDNEYFSGGAKAAREKADHYRSTYSLPPKYFLSSNRFVEKKNLFRLVEAYADYRRRAASPWDLVILGDGELMPSLRDRVGALELDGHVMLPGFKQYEEIPVYYGLAGCYVQASISEQWGLVVNEAMASGLPVLVSRMCGCAEDLVHEGENGFTFDPFDVSDMADKMLTISSGDCDLQQMGVKSHDVISHWGCENFGKHLWQAAEWAFRNPVRRDGAISKVLLRAMLSYR